MILSTALLLRWLGARHRRSELDQAATRIEEAVETALQDISSRTADLGGASGTRSFGEAVCVALRTEAAAA
jgi:3-isopropylmalate dehydrogenase